MKILPMLVGATGMLIAAVAANAEGGQKAFCLQTGTSGTAACSYDTMEQCKKAMTGATDKCSPRSATGDGVKPKK